MSYQNRITEPDKHTLDCEYHRGFSSGKAVRIDTCKLTKEDDTYIYRCSQCGFVFYLEGYDAATSGYKFCPGCGAKITEVEK